MLPLKAVRLLMVIFTVSPFFAAVCALSICLMISIRTYQFQPQRSTLDDVAGRNNNNHNHNNNQEVFRPLNCPLIIPGTVGLPVDNIASVQVIEISNTTLEASWKVA